MATPIGTLWGIQRQPQTRVILSVAALNDFELKQPTFSFQDKPADFTEKFSYGKIPAFEGTDGFKLIEGLPISRYLSSIGTKVNLLGSKPQEAAVVDQWVHFAEHEIGIPGYGISTLIYGSAGPFNQETFDKTTERLVRALNQLESHLAACPSGYLASDTLTLADLVVASIVHALAHIALGSAERAQYPRIFAHHAKVTGNEKVKQYFGTDGFVEVRLTEPTKPSWA